MQGKEESRKAGLKLNIQKTRSEDHGIQVSLLDGK